MVPIHQKLLQTLDQKAQVHLESGEIETALRWCLSSLETARNAFATDLDCLPYLMRAFNRLAIVHRAYGRIDAAQSLLEESLTTAEAAGGVDPLELALILSELSSLADEDGDWQKAVSLLRRALKMMDRVNRGVGEDSSSFRNNLAMILKREGQHADAEKHYLWAREDFRLLYGAESEKYAAVCNNLAGLYEATGRTEKAAALFEEALAIRTNQGAAPDELGQSLCNLAAVYDELGKVKKADQLYRKALDVLKNHLDQNAEVYAITSQNYAAFLAEQHPGDLKKTRKSRKGERKGPSRSGSGSGEIPFDSKPGPGAVR